MLLLQKIGYTYLTPDEAMAYRVDNRNVILDGILVEQLKKINKFTFRGKEHEFTPITFEHALEDIKRFPLVDGQIKTNEKVYDLLTLGTSYEQTVGYDRKSFNFHFIDWQHPQNNVFHVTEEFEVAQPGKNSTLRPDIICFVNGIPLAVIECKRPEMDKDPIVQAISQHTRNQKLDGIPDLFKYSQILMAVCADRAKYGTAGTPSEFWSVWKDPENLDAELDAIKNRGSVPEKEEKIFGQRFRYVREYFTELQSHHQHVTEQDRAIYALLRPDRLLEFTYRYMVYDGGDKKIARYQQVSAVRKTLNRIKALQGGRRIGGVVYHTQGSGKSLTMVMMAKAIALEPTIIDPKIILVTDRIDLDDQIYKTFNNCGLQDRLKQATSGRDLLRLLKSNKASIITTIIGKFETLLERERYTLDSPNIFVLVDESHRSNYGVAAEKMRQVLPNSCYIGFTGTPLLRPEKSTALKFGGYIDKYTINQAVEDGAVVPLVYEGREVMQSVNQKAIDTFFEKITRGLTQEQVADLKKKFARADQLNETEQKLQMVVWDVVEHFTRYWKGTDFKAQLTAPSKSAAIKLKQMFDVDGRVSTEVLISGPDTRDGSKTIYEELEKELVLTFWKNMMSRYGTEKEYNQQLINQFKNGEEPEIIIVVDKLLTGFDAPRNRVLYIARSLKEHSLLQAIARVNRVYKAKNEGYIIDYYGIFGNLNQALNTYTALAGFDSEDVEDTLTSIKELIDKLPDHCAQVWDIFKDIVNRKDNEAYALLLHDKKVRQEFYERLNKFGRTLQAALSSHLAYEMLGLEKLNAYRDDFRFFQNLRKQVRSRYSDSIDYRQYEAQIQKLLDHHVTAEEVRQLTDPVNIFNKEAFEKELEKVEGKAARADTIASRTAKHINEKFNEDPVFYRKFSALLQEVIDAFHEKRISDLEYLTRAEAISEQVVNYYDQSIPEQLRASESAQAYYRTIGETMKEYEIQDKLSTVQETVASEIDRIILENKVVDWVSKNDVLNRMSREIQDYLWELDDQRDLGIPQEVIDDIINKALDIAKYRY